MADYMAPIRQHGLDHIYIHKIGNRSYRSYRSYRSCRSYRSYRSYRGNKSYRSCSGNISWRYRDHTDHTDHTVRGVKDIYIHLIEENTIWNNNTSKHVRSRTRRSHPPRVSYDPVLRILVRMLNAIISQLESPGRCFSFWPLSPVYISDTDRRIPLHDLYDLYDLYDLFQIL